LLNLANGNFVASINGKAYYPIGCKASERIKEENRVWFETTEEAESQGYQPAKNCSGF
jgi:methylphosphotriester-DNA--protein-cysteine methyltransferase